MLPIDLVLVRHGQSEGNAAKRLSKSGNNGVFTPEFRGRHTSSFRLTELGRMQASLAGAFLKDGFFKNGTGFDRYITSEYIRAMETAGLLQLPNAEWFCDVYLTERNWGEFDVCPENEREEKFGTAIHRYKVEPFFSQPPNGESFAQLCLRVDRVLHTLHRECGNKRVLLVCHGEVMRAFQVRLERMSQVRFRELFSSQRNEDLIYNCQILHYTRRDPAMGDLAPYANWKRMVRPTAEPIWDTGWQQIMRPRYSNQDLLDVVSQIPAMIV